MYQTGGTISDLLTKVGENEFILPAIQREFVWQPDQICRLFDSLMQGYPFGTFLFWKIKQENQSEYQFYDFVQHFHERDRSHCELLGDLPAKELTAVLDGQQRITALNIGLRGSYAWKIPGKWWTNNDAFPQRNLYLNLLGESEDDHGSLYQFEFLTDTKANEVSPNEYWFRASRILTEDHDELMDHLDDEELAFDSPTRKKARATLRLFHRTIHDKHLISYYEETNQNLEHVLNIFIRMNSGGTPLS